MLCRRTTVFPIECVVRGYLSGSAWKEYAAQGTLAGEKLPPGLLESAKLEPAIFSPATKAETGHDENITIARMREVLGDEVAVRAGEHEPRRLHARREDRAASRASSSPTPSSNSAATRTAASS